MNTAILLILVTLFTQCKSGVGLLPVLKASRIRPWSTCLTAVPYGPPSEHAIPSQNQNDRYAPFDKEEKKAEYKALLESILSASNPQHIPSLLAKNTELLLSLAGKEGSNIAQSIIEESRATGGDALARKMEEAMDLTLFFAEDFVAQASRIDDQNKELLGKILRSMSDKKASPRQREEGLDDLFASEREKLTAGFLRHVEGECERIAAAPNVTADSRRLLEMLRIIQARVVEELGQDLGEAAQVLGQLIGYNTASERLAVLEAGLTVRGVSFARELKDLTVEALDGFERVIASKPDPELINIVKEIDQSLQDYLDDNSAFE